MSAFWVALNDVNAIWGSEVGAMPIAVADGVFWTTCPVCGLRGRGGPISVTRARAAASSVVVALEGLLIIFLAVLKVRTGCLREIVGSEMFGAGTTLLGL